MGISEWQEGLEREREMKDRFFAEHWQSPIPAKDRTRFKGLDYFPPDLAYRFELELHQHEEKRIVRMAYTKGQEQDFLRWGELRFKVGDKEQAIQAYRSNSAEERLFILFRDATSGKETYGAGRYLDLEPDKNRTADGKWILDPLIKHTIPGAYIVKITLALLCPRRIGLKHRYVPARRIST